MSACYFGAESCRHGHTADCPARSGNPWEAEREQSATVVEFDPRRPLAEDHPFWRGTIGNFSLGEE